MSTIRFDDNRGGLAYPFLCVHANDAIEWQITSRPFDNDEALAQIFEAETPTLRWVKDDKVLDLTIPSQDMARFLADSGLRLSMAKGGYVLSKRLSRIMRPYRYYGFFNQDEVTIDYNESLNGRLWDGSGLVSRSFIQRLADSLDLDDRHRRELLQTNRFEVTTLHSGGQDKGHVLVVDDPPPGSGQAPAVDFTFPAGSAKTELALAPSMNSELALNAMKGQAGQVFVGLHPVHSADQMCLDIQSIINLYPFFRPEHLLAWAQMESEMFLQGIANGRLAGILNRLYEADSASDLDSLADWHVGEYIASGGSLMWFAGMVKAVARQHLNRLGSRASKLRCPAPGGRYYLFPAAVGQRDVPPGHVELDPACATAWVNDQDWLTYIVDVLGGCDGDDAVWVLPFSDLSDSGRRKLLVWRSPNQLGEYVVLQPTANSHLPQWEIGDGRSLSCPQMKSCLLPNRIDSVSYQYSRLTEASSPVEVSPSYSIAAMTATIRQAAANQGVLGGFCNVAMLCRAIYGRLPDRLPATLEAVIDGSVKTGLDLGPVKAWNQMALGRMVKHGRVNARRAMPVVLLDRLPVWLRPQAKTAADHGAPCHWLDTLAEALEQHKAQYWADVEALAAAACPPLPLFEYGRDWLHLGKELRQVYGRAMRQVLGSGDEMDEAGFAAARSASETFLSRWPAAQRQAILLGAAAYLYVQGGSQGEAVRDGLLWQLGRPLDGGGREPGVAQEMIAALRQIGLLGEPVWTTAGAVLYYRDEASAQPAGVPVRLNGVWLNWLNATGGRRYRRMADVPPALRDQAKARIADFVQDRFRGMVLFTEVTDNNRVITRTPHGNLFGYVQRDHELAAIRHDQWRIAWAHVVDGNVMTILQPA